MLFGINVLNGFHKSCVIFWMWFPPGACNFNSVA